MNTPDNRRRLWLAARVAVLVGACAYLLTIVPLGELLPAMAEVELHAVAAAVGLLLLGTVAAAWRWKILFAACGFTDAPPTLELLRLHLIGAFYNNFVPGGLGGDLVRAAATRTVAANGGFTTALAIVFLERTLGLTALVILVAASFSLWPLEGIPHVFLWSGLGIGAATAAVVGVSMGRRLAPYLPGFVGRIAAGFPTVRSLPRLGAGLGLSIVTNVTGVLAGHAVVVSIAPGAALTQSLVILPLASLAAYFPLTIGGVGVREGAFVVLWGLVGVAKSHALASSLVFFGCSLLYAMVGGVLHVLRPLTPDEVRRASERPGPAP